MSSEPSLTSGFAFPIEMGSPLKFDESCREITAWTNGKAKDACAPSQGGFRCLTEIDKLQLYWFSNKADCDRALVAATNASFEMRKSLVLRQ